MRRLQTEIAIITTEVEYISLYQAMTVVLPLVDTPTVLCSPFENPVIFY